MPNTDNINIVIESLRAEQVYRLTHEHSHFTMHDWVRLVDDARTKKERPTLCKTAACIAGTAVMVLEPSAAFQWNEAPWSTTGGYWSMTDEIDWNEKGAELLGLDQDLASNLFYRESWPSDLLVTHGSWGDDLSAAIFLLEEIRDGRLEMDEHRSWIHPDLEEWDDHDDDDDDDLDLVELGGIEPDEDDAVDEAKLDRHDRES